MSEAFGVCVKGFTNNVLWCITWNESPLKITSRGNVFYENPNDPLAGIGAHPSCANFHKKVLDLQPDITSCKGKKTEPEKKCVNPSDIPVLDNASDFQLASFSMGSADFGSSETNELRGLKLTDGFDKDPEIKMRVALMQRRLNHHGASLNEDGIFGNNTLESLNQFQNKIGNPKGTTVDDKTAAALMLPSNSFGDSKLISTIEGLKIGDGLVWGTWQLRPRVKHLQQLLAIHGHFTKADGMFGPKTKHALNTFQSSHDITTSDVVDTVTADTLEGRRTNICPNGLIPLITV